MQASAQGKNKEFYESPWCLACQKCEESGPIQKQHGNPKITRCDRRFGNSKAAESSSAACKVVGTGAQLETLYDTALFFR